MQLLNIIIFFTIFFISNAYLTPLQKKLIKNIIQNKDISIEVKNKTKEIIAVNYTPWALSQYKIFVNKNRSYLYKKHIPLNDLRQYAIIGMIKALEKYNGSVDFTVYAEKYILGTLHQGVTDLIPLRPISHSLRMNGKDVPSITFAHENTWMFDKLYKAKDNDNESDKILKVEDKYISRKSEIERINNIVKQLTPYEQNLFYYRYSKDTLKEIRTVATVSELMCCSTETYRKKMNKIIEKIRDEINE
jgi:RNA polymerase sigma factor (sigma-70 family)